MTDYTSDELFHFVGRSSPADDERNYSVLRSILRTGEIGRPPFGHGWNSHRFTFDKSGDILTEQLLVPEIVCFADIPFPSLGLHSKKYGRFAVSLHRAHLVRYGTRPVTYFPYDPSDIGQVVDGVGALRNIEATYRGVRLHRTSDAEQALGVVPSTLEEALQAAEYVLSIQVLAFLKPFNNTLHRDDERNYYMEREWRRLGNVLFEPKHVASVVLPESFIQRINVDEPEYCERVRVLAS